MIDTLLSHYRLEKQIGAGGMGVVYRAYDTKLQRQVAIKLLHNAPDQSGRSRLVQEARAASALNHPNVCVIHEVEHTGERAFIVMEYVEGRPLRELLPRDGLPVETVVRYGIQIADALTHAHERGVIHRDLKSLNVVITPDGLAKVLDFGLARRLQQEELEQITHSQASTVVVSASNNSLIGVGQCVGTLPYMPPEMLRGEMGDERSDLWSFGVLLYEMAAGTLPFRGKTAFELSAAVLRETPIPLPPAVPAGLRSVILRCLTKEALQRYRNAGEVRAALETVQRDLESPSPHPSRLQAVARSIRRRPTWKTTLAGAAALVAIVALTFGLPVSRRLVVPSSSSLVRARIAAGQQTVGVFPFRPLVGEAYVGHIAGGFTESLAARLFPAKALRLAPVGAVERAVRKGSIEQAARELGLDMMLTGTVRQIAGRLRINVSIDDAKSGKRLWTEDISGFRSGLLVLEERLHNLVMEAMEVQPASKQGDGEAWRPPTANVEAYDLYLRARNAMRETPGAARTRDAIALYEEASSKDGRFALAYAGQSQAFLELYWATQNREWAESAQVAADRARQLDTTRPEAHLAVGMAYNVMGKAADAIPAFLRVIDLAPNSDAAYRELGRACGAIGWSQEAMQSLHKAVEINAFEPENYDALGSIAGGLGKYSEAADAFRKVIELEPDRVRGYSNLGAMQLKMGRFDEAATAFQYALTINENAIVYTNLGITYANIGRFADAVRMLQKAVDLGPNEARLLNLADAYRWLGERARADPIYDKAIAVALQKLKARQDPGTIAALALSYAKRGKFPQATQYIAMARRVKPDDVDFVYYDAIIQLLADRIPQALGSLRDAFRAGFSREFARQDPDLRILQADPRFRELMTEFRETAAASELRQTLQKWMQDRGLRTTVQRSSPQ